MNSKTVNFHSIDKMPLLEEGINGILNSSEEQLPLLNEAAKKPHVLDDATVNRIIKVFTEQSEHLPFYEQQFILWQKETLNSKQEAKLNNMLETLEAAKILNVKILGLANQLKHNTIERVMEKDDVELALDFLKGL